MQEAEREECSNMPGMTHERIKALSEYQILDTPREDSFDAITKLASEICGTPYAAISFAEADRQWFKSEIGFTVSESTLKGSFCAHAIAQEVPLVVPDASLDPRFKGVAYVAGSPGIRFYAGIQLRSIEGVALGVLCVLDVAARVDGLSIEQCSALRVLANQVEAQLELRRAINERDAKVLSLRRVTKKLRHVARHDTLTSLPNRKRFGDILNRVIKSSESSGMPFALMLIDVDHFKQINDALGHDAGDALLRKFADNLTGAVRASDTVARIGGDEFAVILQDAATGALIPSLLASIYQRLDKPIRHRGRFIECRASIGIAQFPRDADTAEGLTKCSDLALASAKKMRGCAVVFQPHLRDDFDERQQSAASIREALEAGKLEPFYQPKVDLVTGAVVGFEALMRRELNGSFVSLPEAFDPGHLDESLLSQIRFKMTQQILDDVAHWKAAGVGFRHVAINSCASDFARDDFGETLLKELQDRGLVPSVIELEVTEGVFVGRGASHVARALELLCSAGVRIALDDFGTGFASLTHLKQFPVDVLKIDRSFISGIGKSADDAAIVRAVIGLGRHLGIDVVAEGIETRAQEAFVQQYGCGVGQGFLYGEAIPANKVPGLTHSFPNHAAA